MVTTPASRPVPPMVRRHRPLSPQIRAASAAYRAGWYSRVTRAASTRWPRGAKTQPYPPVAAKIWGEAAV